MTQKLAAGLILFRKIADSIEYLLLQTSYGENHWTPPKGHLDEGEDYKTAAVRETQEEAGLIEGKDYLIFSTEFSIDCNYVINGSKPKKVVYWLAEAIDPNVEIKLSDEHISYKWLTLNPACDIVKYKEMQQVLQESEAHIRNAFENKN